MATGLHLVVLGTLGIVLSVTVSSCGSPSHSPAEVAENPTTATSVAAPVWAPARLDPEALEATRGIGADAVPPEFPYNSQYDFDVVVLGKVLDVNKGPAMRDYEGDKDGWSLALVTVEPVAVLRGKETVGEPIYVQIAHGDVDGLRKVLTAGTYTFMAATVMNPSEDKHLIDPRAGYPDGAERYIAGAAFAGFADGANATWFPVLDETA